MVYVAVVSGEIRRNTTKCGETVTARNARRYTMNHKQYGMKSALTVKIMSTAKIERYEYKFNVDEVSLQSLHSCAYTKRICYQGVVTLTS